MILITTASRKVARNINLCLDFYNHLTGQKPLVKSEIYFPLWFNKKVASSICSILNFKPDKLPFKHLGVNISHRQLHVSSFDPMVDKLNGHIANWRKAKMSKAGKAVVINSIIMATPTYYLSIYLIPESVLNKISKIPRKFLWSNSDKDRSLHLVNWTDVTTNKSEGGFRY